MINKGRTITKLRKRLKGKIYVYLKNKKICNEFLKNAEEEGFLFGQIKPTESSGSDIIVIESNTQLSYVGFVGHMAFQCPSGIKGEFYRIDYDKYIKGFNDFFMVDDANIEDVSDIECKEFDGKYYQHITMIGSNCENAYKYIKNNLSICESRDDENRLFRCVETMFSVIILN